MEIDFSQKMRPRRGNVKIIEHESKPSDGTLFFANRAELYQLLNEDPAQRRP